ncbi:MAG: tetratricopeptide repeat protein [Gammaproteobacteria bacterium]|nr:MAG: tetratricopeptide repeat protein [Gammaproteobacteria bacterium]
MLKPVIALLCCIAVPAVEAQVRVVDSSPQSVRSGAARQQESVEQKTESYNQIQSLLQEVSELRALVEEQGHELSRLKQLQLDNYVDLDRRVSSLGGASKAQPRESDQSVEASPAPLDVSAPVNEGASEADEYKAAYDLLRQRQVDQSLVAFKEYLKKYPAGEFSANSCYWLGEIFLLKNQLPQARDWFSKLLQDFPESTKVPDAKFKLGKVYHLMGDKKRAKPLLEDAAKGLGDSARLAKQYLQDNF